MTPALMRTVVAIVAGLLLIVMLHSAFNNDFDITTIATTSKKPSQSSLQNDKLYGDTYQGRSSPAEINRVANKTLGFSKVFAIGLPERSDKRDALTLSAALTGFHVEWIDGIEGDSIVDKAIPFGINRHGMMASNLGSWRGHMNAIRRIVEEDLESALIVEDDVDWDVRLRSQLEDIAMGSRMLLESKHNPSSPYGDGWDVFWIGHCGEPFPEYLDENKNKPDTHAGIQYMKRRYAIENDITVPPPEKTTGMIDFNAYPYTRFVHISAAPICSFAYALSQSGARKVLFDLSVDHLTGAFDNALADLCRRSVSSVGEDGPNNDRGLDTKCISVTPPVFFHHKAKGAISGDSDINEISSNDIRQKGTTENIMWSARNNIYNMIMNGEMESQF